MRILVHDFGAYAFPVQLSRELAHRGHEVLHLFSDFVPRKGRLWIEGQDPANLHIKPVSIGEERQKYSYVKRWKQERAYGNAVVKEVKDFRADLVFSCNTPLDSSCILQKACKKADIPYVHWTQDIHALAIRSVLGRKLPIIGSFVSNYYLYLEKRVIEQANATIVISDDFTDEFKQLKINPQQTHIIPNWMPLDEMLPGEKENVWSIKHGLEHTFNIVYVGTLSFKHNETLFVEMAKHFVKDSEVRIVIISAGIVFDKLVEIKNSDNLDNLVLLGWQDYREIANLFATGDILMAMVNPDASAFSVPCKVLSYLSAGRAILAAVPKDNLIAKILETGQMGLTASPLDSFSVIKAAEILSSDPALRQKMAEKGREYALHTFDIKLIADKFESIVNNIVSL
jgi:colanic acid biosynthesis glycosyl transferase WcaI